MVTKSSPRRGRRATAKTGGWRCATALAFVLAFHGASVPVLAQNLSPAVTVSNFEPVTLAGIATSTTAIMSDFSVTDSAGTGWNVTVSATQFAEFDTGTGQYVSGGKVLPVGSLTMPAPTVSPAHVLVLVTPGPYAIDGATVKITSANAGTSGTWDFTHGGSLTLTVPASAYAVVYRSDVTVAVASGP